MNVMNDILEKRFKLMTRLDYPPSSRIGSDTIGSQVGMRNLLRALPSKAGLGNWL